MRQLQYMLLLVCMVFSSMLFAQEPEGKPSRGAMDMLGAKGTFAFKPTDWIVSETTWWKDTDGVAPETAGCHVVTDKAGKLNGRTFGEACKMAC